MNHYTLHLLRLEYGMPRITRFGDGYGDGRGDAGGYSIGYGDVYGDGCGGGFGYAYGNGNTRYQGSV